MKRQKIFLWSIFSLLIVSGCADVNQLNQPAAPPVYAPAPVNQASATLPPAVSNQKEEFPADATLSLSRNFYIVFDGSGSMEGDRLSQAKQATRQALGNLPNSSDVNLGLYVFDNSGDREVVPLGSNNKTQVLAAIDGVVANSGTPLAEAIIFGSGKLEEQYKRQLGYGEYRLIVVTDGEANGNIPITEVPARLLALRAPVGLCTIGFQLDGNHTLSRYSLSYQNANDTASLAKALGNVLAESTSFDEKEFK